MNQPYSKILYLCSYLSARCRNIIVVCRFLPRIVRFGGGSVGTLKRAWFVYMKEGVSGIKARILFVAHAKADNKPRHKINNTNDYKEWVRRYDTLAELDRNKIRLYTDNLKYKPSFSIIMTVCNTSTVFLDDAIQSVREQLYHNWELYIVDNRSTDPVVGDVIKRHSNEDCRIAVINQKDEVGVAVALNSALNVVTGKYCMVLGQNDLLAEHALFCVTQTILKQTSISIIYSDEDRINESDIRFDPHFKSEWNPDLMLSYNMFSHFTVYKTDLIRSQGGFREGYDGFHDYDLALRCTETLASQQIVHIPRILYHHRSYSGSEKHNQYDKSLTLWAGQKALKDHFERTGMDGEVEVVEGVSSFRVRYTIPQQAPLVTLIIPTRDGFKLLEQCINSILEKTLYKNYEILLVDNNSEDPKTIEYLNSLKLISQIRIIQDNRSFNYSAINNAAVMHANGEYLGLINDDIEVISPTWLDEMMSFAIQKGVGAVGARLWYPNRTLQHGGCILGLGGIAGHAHKNLLKNSTGYYCRAQLIQSLSAVTAACLVIKKNIYLEVGGLDEKNLTIAYNDIDFCLRVREAGFRNIWTPYAELYHHESATRGYEDTREKVMRIQNEGLYMMNRWGDLLKNDPAYSPNLTLDREDFSYAWPPRTLPLV